MQIVITATDKITHLEGVPVRVWEGVTEGGVPLIFGEISRVDAEAIVGEITGTGTGKPVWQERIAKSGTIHARILQIMLDGGGPMGYKQIASAARTGGNTSARLGELIAKNWVHKIGHGQYALKETC